MNHFVMGAIFGGLFGALFGVIFALYRRYLLRVPRLIGRRLKILPRKAKAVGRKTGTAGLSSHAKVIGDLPAILRELHIIDDTPEDGAAVYDFTEEDRQLVTRKKGFKTFKQPNSGYFQASDADPDRHADLARRFFSSPIQVETDADNLYDEEEGAVIVKMFRRSDRPMLYAIDKFRCVVGDNARRMVVKSIFAVIWIGLIGALLKLLIALKFDIARQTYEIILIILAIIALCPLAALWLRTNVYYSNARDTGFGDFKALLQSYFAGVSDKFVNAHSKMSHAILGEEDQDFLADNAEKSHKIMLWHALRILFMENFLRNEYYQMRRNLRFYQLYYAFSVIAAGIAVFWIMGLIPFDPEKGLGWVGFSPWLFFIAALVVGLGVWWLSIGRKDTEHQIENLDWRGFEALHMDERMREIIGAYAKEAGIGKHRFTRGKT